MADVPDEQRGLTAMVATEVEGLLLVGGLTCLNLFDVETNNSKMSADNTATEFQLGAYADVDEAILEGIDLGPDGLCG